MTRISKFSLFLLTAAFSLGIMGCTKSTKHPTPIAGYTGPGPTGTENPSPPLKPTPANTGNNGRLTPDNVTTSTDRPVVQDRGKELAPRDVFEDRQVERELLKGDTIYFEYDRARIQSSERAKLAAVAEYLKSNPTHDLLVEGHCDERGTEEYNRALGERRALAAREQLATLGIAGSRVRTLSWGEAHPVELGHDEAAWSKNRRAEFGVLLPKTQ